MRRDEPFLRSTPRRIPARGLRHGLCIPAKRLARVNLGPDLLTKQEKTHEPDLPTCAGQEGTPPPTEGLHVPALREATCAAWVKAPSHSVRVQHSPTTSSRVRTWSRPRGGMQRGQEQVRSRAQISASFACCSAPPAKSPRAASVTLHVPPVRLATGGGEEG